MKARKPDSAIVGIGRATTQRGDARPKTPLELAVECSLAAMRQAGIKRTDVGALFTGRAPMEYMTLQYNQSLVNELKVGPTFTSEVTSHGAGGLGTLQLGALAVESGIVDYALCVISATGGLWLDMVGANGAVEADLQFEAPYGVITPALYAQSAMRYMHEYGVKPEQFARVAVECRRWALEHPEAAMRKKGPITVEQVMASRLIASPLRLLDCAVWYPGGIANAVVITRGEVARARHQDPTWLAGYGQCITHEWVGERMGGSGYPPFENGASMVRTGTRVAAKQAYDMAGMKPSDVDIIQTSAPFSFAHLIILEELGFCGEGEGGDFVESGGIDYEGGLPFNTMGGYLSFGQVGQGLYQLHEIVDQMWGHPQGRAVPGVEVGIVHGHGGPLAAHSVMLLSKHPVQ